MALRWERDGAQWPHRDRSRFVDAGGLRWHVQRFGEPGAPAVVLLHGTGASTHSWRGLAPLLHAQGLDVVAMDLPGHGFTRAGSASRVASLPGMASALHALLLALQVRPVLLVGHSAGAAIAVQLAVAHGVQPAGIVSLNGALVPWSGLRGRMFTPLARVLAATPLLPQVFAWRASDDRVLDRLLESTGSSLDPQGRELYRVLVSDADHAAGALAMMANWDLGLVERTLPRLDRPLACMVGLDDRTVPPRQADDVQRLLPEQARRPLVHWRGLGHLAHEEDPQRVAAAIAAFLRSVRASSTD